jgi:ribonuclease HII
MAAAVVLPRRVPAALAALIDDSKQLSARQREAAFAALMAAQATGRVEIALGAASVAEIGRINILRASLLAMRRAVLRLPSVPDLALVDGNMAPDLPCPARCVIGGDGSELAIGAASIIAKVVRDRCMARLDRRYPGYGWPENAGYGTAAHRDALRRLGVTVHHRAGFGTVRQLSLLLEA